MAPLCHYDLHENTPLYALFLPEGSGAGEDGGPAEDVVSSVGRGPGGQRQARTWAVTFGFRRFLARFASYMILSAFWRSCSRLSGWVPSERA